MIRKEKRETNGTIEVFHTGGPNKTCYYSNISSFNGRKKFAVGKKDQINYVTRGEIQFQLRKINFYQNPIELGLDVSEESSAFFPAFSSLIEKTDESLLDSLTGFGDVATRSWFLERLPSSLP